jgi:hypothetical protein
LSDRLIFSDSYQFSLHGASSFGNPYALRFQGTGDTTDSQGQMIITLAISCQLGRTGLSSEP